MIIFSWNYRGFGHATTILTHLEFVLSHRPNVIFLSEIKSCKCDHIVSIYNSLGFTKFHFVPSVGKSSGLF